MCLDGHGPFPFIIDTGASSSALTASLSGALKLPVAGAPQTFFGIGHTLSGRPVRVRAWSVGSIRLRPQELNAAHLDLPTKVDGLLGADVLSRFGTIRLDYDSAELIIDSRENAKPASAVTVGSTQSRLPRFFSSFHPQAQIPITVAELQGQAVATADVKIGGHDLDLTIDTGADISAVTSAAAGPGVVAQSTPATVAGVGGTSRAVVERVSSWSMGSIHLVPEDLVAVQFPAATSHVLDGLIGADVLSQFRAITIDYTDGLLAVDQVPVL